MMAASVWGNPAPGAYLQTHNATQVGMERMAAFLNQLPYCLDELQLSKDRRGQARIDVYQLAEGIGRTRGTQNGGLDQTPTWCNCFLSTGETPIAAIESGAGAINRVIDIECTADTKVVSNGACIANAVRENHGFAGRIFVERLYESEAVQSMVRDIYNDNRQDLIKRGVTEKQAMAGSAILTADQLATHWIFKDENALTEEDMLPYLARNEQASLGAAAYDYLCDWVAANTNHFQTDLPVPAREIYGVIDDSKAYIIYATFRKALENAGYNTRAILSYLRSQKLIEDRGDKGYTKTKRIGASTPQCVILTLRKH